MSALNPASPLNPSNPLNPLNASDTRNASNASDGQIASTSQPVQKEVALDSKANYNAEIILTFEIALVSYMLYKIFKGN